MKRCSITLAFKTWLFAQIIVQPAFAQLSGSVIYNYIDLSAGAPVVRLASINADGSSDQYVPLPLLNPYYPAWSPDGQSLAVAGVDPARPNKLSTDVYLWRPANGQLAKLSAFEDTANASGFLTFYPSYLAVAPDGQRVAAGMVSYLGARATVIKTNSFGDPYGPYDVRSKVSRCVSLVMFNAAGGDPFLVVNALCADDESAHPGEGVDWSPVQDLLAYPYNAITTFSGPGFVQRPITTIHLIEPTAGAADQGKQRQLTFPSGVVGTAFDSFRLAWADDFAPAFSPDGRQVAYVRLYTVVTPDRKLPSVPSIRIVGVDGSNDHEIKQFDQGSYITRLSWSPDAKQLVFDLGRQALRDGFPLPTFDFNTVAITRINTDGTGLAQIRGVPATWPAWRPGTAQPPPPAIASLQPTTVPANSAGFDLTVNGSGFTPDSVILWNGGALPTTFVSAIQLRGAVAGSRLAATGQITITVSSSGGSATTSNPAFFTINASNPNGNAPRLTITFFQNVTKFVVIAWPHAGGNFILESTDELGPQANWMTVATTPTTGAGQISVTLNVSGNANYYRLKGQ